MEFSNPLQKIIEQYEKGGFGVLEITFLNNEKLCITLKETYYSSKNFHEEMETEEIYKYDNLNRNYLDKHYARDMVKTLEKSEIGYIDEKFVIILHCDFDSPEIEDEDGFEFVHEHKMQTINVDHIVSITGYDNWELDGHVIDDEEVLAYILRK